MTNDGYLGKTAGFATASRQRSFSRRRNKSSGSRTTNVGVTAYINERGEISDASEVLYGRHARLDDDKIRRHKTIYVKYGDWFAWLFDFVSLGFINLSFWKGKIKSEDYKNETKSFDWNKYLDRNFLVIVFSYIWFGNIRHTTLKFGKKIVKLM